MNKEIIEKLAEQEHESWSSWMRHLFSKCQKNRNPNSDFVIPSEFVQRWTRQMKTNYFDLPEEEKESDRVEVRKFLKILEPIMEGKNYKNVICEAKDLKAFTTSIKELIKSDTKASKFKQAFLKDNEKIVDLIDYMLGKHEKEVTTLMKIHNANYDELIKAIGSK